MTRRHHAPLDALLTAQDGVLTRAQAVGLGTSPDAVDRRLAARRWVPVHPRVYRDVGYPPTDAARIRAAALWAGEGAVLSGSAAAWWWGLLDAPPRVVDVTVPRRRAPRARAGVRVRRRDLDAADVAVRDGVAVVVPATAVLGATLEPGIDGADLLTRILCGTPPPWGTGPAGAAVPPGAAAVPGAGTGIVDGAAVPDLAALVAAQRRGAGAHGSAATGRTLAVATRRAGEAASHRLRALLLRGRTPGWRTDHQVAGVVLRLACPAARIAVDVRGADPASGNGDGAWRRAVLRRLGWQVLELDPAEVWTRPAAVVAGLAEAG